MTGCPRDEYRKARLQPVGDGPPQGRSEASLPYGPDSEIQQPCATLPRSSVQFLILRNAVMMCALSWMVSSSGKR